LKLYALGDLHLRHESNRKALLDLVPHPEDWLIIAGDVGETEEHLRFALTVLSRRFARLLWVPGNHDLWTIPPHPDELRGDLKYRRMVELCRSFAVLTPEDPYITWPGGSTEGAAPVLAPLFLLYDYSFRPDHIPIEEAVQWAAEEDVLCSDEVLLHPDPFPSRSAWCAARCADAERRLIAAAERGPTILINHWPLKQDLAILPRVPRFSVWCGTRRTEDWHVRFKAECVIFGHLHIRATHFRDGVRFEEVSLGYPQNWNAELGIEPYLRQILPDPRG
jgi:3',5'-cyclic AMP phosphodiesterase CpdA